VISDDLVLSTKLNKLNLDNLLVVFSRVKG